MERIARHNLSGGKLGKPLWTRSDLDQYHKGNHVQTNFQSTPYGGITRRGPTELLGSLPFKDIGGILYQPTTIRGFDFVYDITTKYSILLVGYTSDGEDDVSVFEILSDDGTPKASIEPPYAISTFYDIDYKQVNDIIMFTHPDYPPARLVRFGDASWQYELMELDGGPFLETNIAGDKNVSVGLSTWDSECSYSAGDIVLEAGSLQGTLSWVGTAYSMKKSSAIVTDNPVSVDYGAIATWETELNGDYLINSDDFCSRPSVHTGGDDFGSRFWYPYTYLRVDKAFSASLIVGDTLSTNSDFVESGGQDTFITQFEILEKLAGTTYDYIKCDLEWSAYFIPENILFPDTMYTRNPDDLSVPIPDFPSAYEGYWSSFDWKWYNTDDNFRASHVIVGADTDGGAEITATAGNIAKGGTGSYKALVANTNVPVTTTSTWAVEATPTESELVLIQTNSFAPFSEGDVGRMFNIDSGEGKSLSDSYTTAETSEWVYAIGPVTLTTGNTWSGKILLEATTNGGVNTAILGEISSVNDSHNGTIARNITERGGQVRVRMTTMTGTCDWSLAIPNGYSTIYIIEKFINNNQILARAITGPSTFFQSSLWAFGVFGGDAGYPGTITIHEERLTFGGSKLRPFEIYGSEINNWTNFALGTLETSPVIFRLQSDNVTRICWLVSSQNRLFIGTDFGEYSASTPDEATVISGSNPPRITLHTTYGSDEQKALSVHNEIAHITADRKTMRSVAEGEYKETYGSKDLTVFSPDISGSGIMSIALQRNPYPVIWCRTADDTLAQFTYDVENGIMGWSDVELTDTLIKSHWILPDDNGVDEVYMSVEREEIVALVSGTSSPEVSGMYNGGDGITVKEFFYKKEYPASGDGRHRYISSGGAVFWSSGVWRNVVGFDSAYRIVSNSIEPPETGWQVDTGGTLPVPDFLYAPYSMDDTYSIGKYGNGYGIFIEDAFPVPGGVKFESPDLHGTYTPVSGSGATGSVTVTELNNHIIKIGKLGTARGDCTDILGETYESIVEFTSLIQGQGVLEADNVKVSKMHVYMVESYGGEVSVDGGASWVAIQYDDENLYTGMKSVIVDSSITDDLRVLVRATGTDPFELTGVSVDVDPQTTSTRRNK